VDCRSDGCDGEKQRESPSCVDDRCKACSESDVCRRNADGSSGFSGCVACTGCHWVFTSDDESGTRSVCDFGSDGHSDGSSDGHSDGSSDGKLDASTGSVCCFVGCGRSAPPRDRAE